MIKLFSSVVKGVKKNDLGRDLWFIYSNLIFEWESGVIDFARFFQYLQSINLNCSR